MDANILKRTLRITLNTFGIFIYRVGLAGALISLSKKRVRATLYHAIEDENNPFTSGLNVTLTPSIFSAHLDYFEKHYNVVPVSSLASDDLPPRPLVITFDDGYRTVYENAVPALRKRNMSACVYLISCAVQGELVWVNLFNYAAKTQPEQTINALKQFDQLRDLSLTDALSTLQTTSSPTLINQVVAVLKKEFPAISSDELYTSADEIREMHTKGIEFGFHTVDHFNLSNCSKEELVDQFDSSEITSLINNDSFAYPFGYYSEAVIDQLRNMNYKTVMTVGNNNKHSYFKHIDRSEVYSESHAAIFAQLEVTEPFIAWLRQKLLSNPSYISA